MKYLTKMTFKAKSWLILEQMRIIDPDLMMIMIQAMVIFQVRIVVHEVLETQIMLALCILL